MIKMSDFDGFYHYSTGICESKFLRQNASFFTKNGFDCKKKEEFIWYNAGFIGKY